jgi:hypothetical protein
MGIRGLTDRKDHRLPVIGTLRKGGPKEVKRRKDGTEYTVFGKDLDHYRLVSDDPVLQRRFKEFYTETPREIYVQLPFRTTDQNFSCWKEQWKAGGLVHRCDGETCSIWLTDEGRYSDEPKPCPGGCKEIGRLNVFIREFARIACVTVLTSSKHDILNITGMLRTIESARGDLVGVPFVLTRKLVSVSSNEDGKRVTRNKWLIHIEPETTWAERLIQAQAAASLPELERLALPAPTDAQIIEEEDDTIIGEIVGEYPGWDNESEPEPEPAIQMATQSQIDEVKLQLRQLNVKTLAQAKEQIGRILGISDKAPEDLTSIQAQELLRRLSKAA